ncbi:MAG TPA: MMPL family transporter [Iamia sp.]|nr:MMPL family transporter [Iamia sp.]
MFARLGRWCHDNRWIVLGLWIVALVVMGGVSGALGTKSESNPTLPGESQRGIDILEEHFGDAGAGQAGSIVFRSEAEVTDPTVQEPMEALFGQIDEIDGLTVISPYDGAASAAQVAARGDDADHIAFASIEAPASWSFEDFTAAAEEIRPLIAKAEVPDTDLYLGGGNFAEFEEPSSEVLGIGFAIVILILAFGSVLAMGLPIGVALAGIGLGTTIIGILSNVVTIPDFANILGVMIGLGVGIDYALFIVTRYRENLHMGLSTQRATAVAIDTSGRAVVFAGATVVISLLGMTLMGLSFVTGLAIGAASVVAVTVVASITLLPALLGFAGARVEVTRWRGLITAGLIALALVFVGLGVPTGVSLVLLIAGLVVLVAGFFVGKLKGEVPMRSRRAPEQTFSYRWSRAVQHHPWRSVGAGAALLVVLSIPVLGLRLGFSDEGNYPEGTDTRIAYDMLADGFGPGFNGPLLVATTVPEGTDPATLERITTALQHADGVAIASPAVPNDPEAPTAVLWKVIPTTSPQAEGTTALVDRLRDDVLPAAVGDADLDPAVTGSVAFQVDFSNYLASRLPLFFAAVLTLSFLLLMAVFRSILVPLKAVLMNLLSIGAAYGIVVAGFQWGWLGGLFNFDGAPVEPFMPMMLFAIVFGLSMDYEVFLLSRVKEEWDRTGDSHESVANGLAATARVITAAALIMVFVFGSFLLENDRVIKLFGTGLATAVLLDATIVRMLLVPATMELLGDRNWWLPKWLDRILPKIDVEGHAVYDDDDIDGDAGPAGEAEKELLPV